MSTSSLPASSKPTSVESLDDLLALSLDRLPGVDIAQMNLLCAEGLPGAAGLNVDKCLATLDGWANWVGHETDRHLYRFRCAPADYGHCEGYFRMLMLVTVLQQDFRVRYNPDRVGGIDFRDSRDLFIHGLLEEPHTGTCASMPVLYAAAGRRLGYPLRLVLTHGHVFVRWDSPDGRERFNIECASRGMLSFPDEYYKTWPTPLMEGQVRKGRYLRSLGAAEELAVFVASRGHCLLDNGQTRAARIAYEQACRLEPLSPGHWCWLQKAVHRESRELPPTAESPWHSAKECPGVHPPWPGLVDCSAVEPARGSSLNATRYRNFHPTLGRWIERDPAGYLDGANLYGYVSGNPAGLTDPSGLCGETAPDWCFRPEDWWIGEGVPGEFLPFYRNAMPPIWLSPFGPPPELGGLGAVDNSAGQGNGRAQGQAHGQMFSQFWAGLEAFFEQGYKWPHAFWGLSRIGGWIPWTDIMGDLRSRAAKEAPQIARLWPPNQSDWPEERLRDVINAIVHALWQALITQEYGEDIAEAVGRAHEAVAPYDWDSFADEHNNGIGRFIGKKARNYGEILDMILQALDEGRLIVFPTDPRIPRDIRQAQPPSPAQPQPPGKQGPLPLAPPAPQAPGPIGQGNAGTQVFTQLL